MKGVFQMNREQRAKWERTRAKGRWRFVLLNGVLYWGGLMALAMSLYNPRNLAITVPIYLAGGFFFGLGCWLVGERMYRKSPGDSSAS